MFRRRDAGRDRVKVLNRQHIQFNIIDIVFFLLVIFVIVATLLTAYFGTQTSDTLKSTARIRLVNAANAAVSITTADELKQIQTMQDVETEFYHELKQEMIDFARNNDVLWVYFVRLGADGNPYYIIDNEIDPEKSVTPDLEFILDSASVQALEGVTAATHFGEFADQDYLLDIAAVVDLEYTAYYLSGYAPIYDTDGSIYAIVGVDIMSQELIQQNNMLLTTVTIQIIVALLVLVAGIASTRIYRRRTKESQAASSAKSAFLANMSHEMRTPLNAVIGMTEIGMRASNCEEKDECFTKITVASRHLLGVISDVLDMSKIDADKLELNSVRFSLRDAIDRARAVLGSSVDKKEQTLLIDISPEIPDRLIGDDQRFVQVVANILANAVKFTPIGGSVSLEVRLLELKEQSVCLEVSITDTGIGISKEQQQNLFKAFEQADSTISRKFGGTGLGLALSKRLVEHMGGEISVRSEEGFGSKFTFTCNLALDKEPVPENELREISHGDPDFTGKRILLVEDIEVNREIVRVLLLPTKVEIIETDNGADAIAEFKKGGIDLILMDIQMPEMDGYEATRLIRGSDCPGARTVPIIAMTANVFKEDIQRALRSGMNDHLGKPIDFSEMYVKLLKYLK
jgi:signal transduction histidine kinase